MVQLLWMVQQFLKTLKIGLPYDPAIQPKRPETKDSKEVSAKHTLIAALFTTAKSGGNPSIHQRCTGKQCGYIHIMEYYSAFKWNSVAHDTTLIKPKYITLS